MTLIKRIHAEPKYQSENGDYVLHSDHEAEVARLRAEVEKVRGYEVAPLEAKVAELRAEVEGLRTTLEVIAVGDSRTPHIDAAQALLRSGYWTDEIDTAMGASA